MRPLIIGNCACGTIVERRSINRFPFKCFDCRQKDKRAATARWSSVEKNRVKKINKDRIRRQELRKKNDTHTGTTF